MWLIAIQAGSGDGDDDRGKQTWWKGIPGGVDVEPGAKVAPHRRKAGTASVVAAAAAAVLVAIAAAAHRTAGTSSVRTAAAAAALVAAATAAVAAAASRWEESGRLLEKRDPRHRGRARPRDGGQRQRGLQQPRVGWRR
nr:uncharacterized protein LOC127339613 [Lolium perenne]